MKTLTIILITLVNLAGTLSAGEIKERSEEIINSTFLGSVYEDSKKFVIPDEVKSMVQKSVIKNSLKIMYIFGK